MMKFWMPLLLGCQSIPSTDISAIPPAAPIFEEVTAQSICTISPTTMRVRIMPLGDSITEGEQTPGGYRLPLWKMLWNRPDKYTYVGSLLNGPIYGEHLPEMWHEGHGGWEIGQLNGGIKTWLQSTPADVVLVLAGVNDCLHQHAAGIEQRMASLVADIKASGADVIVGKLPSYTGACGDALNASLSGNVAETNVLEAADLADGIHPNAQGAAKLAAAWDAAIANWVSTTSGRSN